MYIHFYMRPLAKPVFGCTINGFPYVRCYTDINYRVFVKKHSQAKGHEVLLAPWGPHAMPNGTNLLAYWSVARDERGTVAASFDEHSFCLTPWVHDYGASSEILT